MGAANEELLAAHAENDRLLERVRVLRAALEPFAQWAVTLRRGDAATVRLTLKVSLFNAAHDAFLDTAVGCKTNPGSSRTCERGTKCCTVKHAELAAAKEPGET